MSILVELPEDEYIADAFAAFDPGGGFSITSAQSMAWIAQLAYETRWPEKISRISGLWGLQDVRCLQRPAHTTLPVASTRGVIATKGEATILAFAGTDPLNLMNWITDFSLGRLEADVHEGFEAAAATVWDEVEAAIRHAIATGRRLFVTGHSLGAALALVTVDRAAREVSLDQSEVYLFGCPRAGREAFAARYDAVFGPTTYRLVYGKDVVATVPTPELGFRHVGRYLACQEGHRFDASRILADAGSDAPAAGDKTFGGLFGHLADLLSGPPSRSARTDLIGKVSQALAPGIGDHLPDRYCTALKLKADLGIYMPRLSVSIECEQFARVDVSAGYSQKFQIFQSFLFSWNIYPSYK